MLRTMDGWTEAADKSKDRWNFMWKDYASIDDEVSEDVIDNFTDILPPRTMSASMLQVGEPYSHEVDKDGNLKATWMTFEKVESKWYYRGHCFAGRTEHIA